MLLSIVVFAVMYEIPMPDEWRVGFVVCVYVTLLILRQIQRLDGFRGFALKFPKTRTGEILELRQEIQNLRSQLPPLQDQTPPARRGTPEVRAKIRQGSSRVGGAA